MTIEVRSGHLWGLPVMKFTLQYEGALPSSGNKPKNQDKARIRAAFHPQLVDLWHHHPGLLWVEQNRHFPKEGGTVLTQGHHQHPGPLRPLHASQVVDGRSKEILDLCEPIAKHGMSFSPLVRETYALHCGLTVLFQRREPPGRIYQGGDIDGRMKTLLDALAMPQHVEQVQAHQSAPNPLFCLLEDDSLISELSVRSERLLTGDDLPADHARLTIEVDVRVRQATIYNQSFLG